MKALIVETGRARGALAAARALHGAGWTVGVGTPSGRGLASSSNATTWRHGVPSPEANLEPFVAAVNQAVRARGYEVVFGAGDAELIALSAEREAIEAMVPYASHEHVLRAIDKLALAEAAARVGLTSPKTVEATEATMGRLAPPFVVKASLHAPLARRDGLGRLEAEIAEDEATAERRVAEIRAAGLVPILQSLASGRLMGYSVVADSSGAVVAATAQVAETTWPPRTGISARARVIAADPQVAEGVARLLADLSWTGLAQLQFVLADDGRASLIDFNGRFYGSLALAVAAGPNLPAIWAALATGRRPAPAPAPRLGTRYQWLEGDLRRAATERRGGLLPDLLRSLRYSRGAVHGVRARGDARPLWHQIAQVPLRAARRVRS